MADQTFTYDFLNNPAVAFVRLLIPDTNSATFIFSDTEIAAMYQIQASTFQSGMFFSGVQGRTLQQLPLSYFRTAAIALDVLANDKGRLSSVLQILDVKLDPSKASQALRDGAQRYRDIDDESGAFMIIEQTPTDWEFASRWFKQWQRQSAGAFIG